MRSRLRRRAARIVASPPNQREWRIPEFPGIIDPASTSTAIRRASSTRTPKLQNQPSLPLCTNSTKLRQCPPGVRKGEAGLRGGSVDQSLLSLSLNTSEVKLSSKAPLDQLSNG